MKEKSTKLFRTGGSVAVRIPREWAPSTDRVILRKKGASIVITEDRKSLDELARRFANDGLLEFKRPVQPRTPVAKSF